MNETQIFNFEKNEVRTLIINHEPYFVANDVAKTLGYKNPSKATNDHCKKAIKTRGNDSLGRRQEFKVIPESDVYRLIIKSNLPNAEKFENWVMEEVLPAIRKHGAYLTDQKIEEALLNPDVLINLATQLKEERTGRLIAEQRVNELQPKADYYDKILANPGLLPISVIAKNYGMSANKMNQVLHELGVQYKQGGTWLLYSNYQNEGYTHTEMKLWEGSTKMKPNTKWTQKGHLFIYDFLKKHDILPTIETLFDKAE